MAEGKLAWSVPRYTPRFTVHYTDTGESIGTMQAHANGEWVAFLEYTKLCEALTRIKEHYNFPDGVNEPAYKIAMKALGFSGDSR